MKLLDNLLDVIAPYNCLGCGLEGSLLCQKCKPKACTVIPSRCYRCKKLSQDFAICSNCRKVSNLKHVWVRTDYNELAKNLVYTMKFRSARDSAEVIADLMASCLPTLPDSTIICPIPTAAVRKRQRGFDHANLIAKNIAARKGLQYKDALGRHGNIRQLGSSRQERLKQLEHVFFTKKDIKNKQILIVDDVVTTGGTIEAAARTLREAGASRVDAVIFAQK